MICCRGAAVRGATGLGQILPSPIFRSTRSTAFEVSLREAWPSTAQNEACGSLLSLTSDRCTRQRRRLAAFSKLFGAARYCSEEVTQNGSSRKAITVEPEEANII